MFDCGDSSETRLTVDYRKHPTLGLTVPVQMTEKALRETTSGSKGAATTRTSGASKRGRGSSSRKARSRSSGLATHAEDARASSGAATLAPCTTGRRPASLSTRASPPPPSSKASASSGSDPIPGAGPIAQQRHRPEAQPTDTASYRRLPRPLPFGPLPSQMPVPAPAPAALPKPVPSCGPTWVPSPLPRP